MMTRETIIAVPTGGLSAANVSVVMKGFLLRKSRGPEIIFFSGRNFCDRVLGLGILLRFVLWTGCDVGAPTQKTTFLFFCSHPADVYIKKNLIVAEYHDDKSLMK